MNGREALEEFSSFWLKVLLPAAPERAMSPLATAEKQ